MVLSIGKVFRGKQETSCQMGIEAHPDHQPAASVGADSNAHAAEAVVAVSQREATAVVWSGVPAKQGAEKGSFLTGHGAQLAMILRP
jgi:hypothetical protein